MRYTLLSVDLCASVQGLLDTASRRVPLSEQPSVSPLPFVIPIARARITPECNSRSILLLSLREKEEG